MCDNKRDVHELKTIEEGEVLEVVCKKCKQRFFLRLNNNTYNKRAYAKIFRKDTLQRNSRLYYKVYPQRMNVL